MKDNLGNSQPVDVEITDEDRENFKKVSMPFVFIEYIFWILLRYLTSDIYFLPYQDNDV